MSGYLLDTNVISELTRPKPDGGVTRWLESTDERLLHLSVLTLGELHKGIALLTSGKRRTALVAWLASELAPRFAGRILSINAAVAERWGILAAEAQRVGRAIPVIDGLLAATALEHRLTIVSRNVRDFSARGLPAFNPWNQAGT